MRSAQLLIKGCPVGATHGFDSSDNVKASMHSGQQDLDGSDRLPCMI